MGKTNEKIEEDDGKISFVFAIIFIAIIMGLYGAVYAIDHSLPTPLEIQDEETHPDSFIAERARNYLKPLVDIGPKVAGHPNNEDLAVSYLTEKIKEIMNDPLTNQQISFHHQIESGSFFLDYKPHGSINAYASIQNLIVKIHSKDDTPHSVLINTHFDTVPKSPGGSDDGINVAVALEVLRKLSQVKEKPLNNIVFLFNGAEEAGLIAAHAFLAHECAREVRVLVNLEATGGGGKEILFQTGPDEPWLLKYYDVPHPHGNAAGEEVFQSNIIPSDTDFRIFRDFGGYIGYDFAFTRDGYRYHTKYDGFDNIEYGRYQHTGDNILHLVRNLAEAPEVLNPKTSGGKTVFYDIFGLFLIHYSEETGIVINSVVIVVSVLLLIWACFGVNPITEKRGLLVGKSKVSSGVRIALSILQVLILILSVVLSWLLSVGLVALLAVILDACDRTMTWYSVPAINFGLYAAPICAVLLMGNVLILKLFRNIGLATSSTALIQIHIVRTLWTLVLLIGTIMGVRMSYVVMIAVLFNAVATLIVHLIDLIKPNKIWPFLYIISTIIPTMIMYTYGHEVVALFIPILGRFGSSTNPDLLMGLIFSLFTIMIASYYIPLFVYVNKPWYIIVIFGAIFLAAIILIITPVGFPYSFSESHPKLQRYSIYHTMRTIKDDQNQVIKKDSGFYFTRGDRNTPSSIEGIVKSLDQAISLEEDCDLTLACGLPITNSRSIKNLENSIWIPAKQPPFDSDIKYKPSYKDISDSRREYTFSVEGSSSIDLYLSIRKGYDLIDLNLVEDLPESILLWNDQPTYYMSFRYGKNPQAFEFIFVVETSSDWSKPVADIAMITKFIDDSVDKTEEYQSFLDEFPEWAVLTVTGSAQYENYVLKL